jgi:ABC-2 type transport system permease protein
VSKFTVIGLWSKSMRTSLRENIRIVMAIAQKDIIDGIKNKNIISLLVTAVFLLIFYRYLPSITESIEDPRLIVYDAGQSQWVDRWNDLPSFELRTSESVDDLKNSLADLDWIALGMVLPTGFDAQLESNQAINLTGYVAHWADQEELADLKAFYEETLSQATGEDIRITISDEYGYPLANSKGPGFLASIAVAIVSSMAGLMILVHLLLEERQEKTIDLLMVSPAGYGHLAVAKLLAGTFFGLILTVVALIANAYLVTHWVPAILAVVMATIFNTALGLLLGSFISTKQQLTIWGMVVINILLIPAFLEIMDDLFPRILIQALQWHPGVAITHAMRLSYTESFDLGLYLPRIGLLVGYTIVVLGLTVLKLRRDEK